MSFLTIIFPSKFPIQWRFKNLIWFKNDLYILFIVRPSFRRENGLLLTRHDKICLQRNYVFPTFSPTNLSIVSFLLFIFNFHSYFWVLISTMSWIILAYSNKVCSSNFCTCLANTLTVFFCESVAMMSLLSPDLKREWKRFTIINILSSGHRNMRAVVFPNKMTHKTYYVILI